MRRWDHRDLGERETGLLAPHRRMFTMDSVGLAQYVEAFHLWRAIHRDAVPTDAERGAQFEVIEEHLQRLVERRST